MKNDNYSVGQRRLASRASGEGAVRGFRAPARPRLGAQASYPQYRDRDGPGHPRTAAKRAVPTATRIFFLGHARTAAPKRRQARESAGNPISETIFRVLKRTCFRAHASLGISLRRLLRCPPRPGDRGLMRPREA